jgi:hypothetical protein
MNRSRSAHPLVDWYNANRARLALDGAVANLIGNEHAGPEEKVCLTLALGSLLGSIEVWGREHTIDVTTLLRTDPEGNAEITTYNFSNVKEANQLVDRCYEGIFQKSRTCELRIRTEN